VQATKWAKNTSYRQNAGKMVLNEDKIIEGVKKKDSRSQALLYKQHASFLYGMALRYTRCGEDAQDVLQEAFIKIFDSIWQYSKKGSLRAWMMRIVINEAIFLYRERSKQPTLENFEDYQEIVPDLSAAVSDNFTHDILLGFIQDLSDGYRTVFNLCEIEGYAQEEVAKMLRCNASTLRSQLSKAKNLLRKKVNEFIENEKT